MGAYTARALGLDVECHWICFSYEGFEVKEIKEARSITLQVIFSNKEIVFQGPTIRGNSSSSIFKDKDLPKLSYR